MNFTTPQKIAYTSLVSFLLLLNLNGDYPRLEIENQDQINITVNQPDEAYSYELQQSSDLEHWQIIDDSNNGSEETSISYSVAYNGSPIFYRFAKTLELGEVVTDIDGNEYTTVVIGQQTWMVESLRTTRYRNGDPIRYEEAGVEWLESITEGAYGIYQNDPEIAAVYGNFYNGYAPLDERGIAPVGWRVPTRSDFEELVDFLGGTDIAGSKLKATGNDHWGQFYGDNEDATNESGFMAFGGGIRMAEDFDIHGDGRFWSSTSRDDTRLYHLELRPYNTIAKVGSSGFKNWGFMIRCIKE